MKWLRQSLLALALTGAIVGGGAALAAAQTDSSSSTSSGSSSTRVRFVGHVIERLVEQHDAGRRLGATAPAAGNRIGQLPQHVTPSNPLPAT